MANTFFGFDTALNNDSHLLPDDDDGLGEAEEDEYDALNDETFGGLDDSTALNDDWEEQHAQFAHYDENSKQTERIENSIRDLVLEHDDVVLARPKPAVWQQVRPPPASRNGDAKPRHVDVQSMPTVEEIEKLCKPPPPMGAGYPVPHLRHMQPPHLRPPPAPARLPPGFLAPLPGGFHPLPPGLQHHPHYPQQQRMHPGYPPCMPPRPMSLPPGLRPSGPYPPGLGLLRPPMGFPPPFVAHFGAHLRQMHVQPPRQAVNKFPVPPPPPAAPPSPPSPPGDEYAGLMTLREKQWLLNIQHMQLNTGTPYFDDYYYTVFKERRARASETPEWRCHLVRRAEPSAPLPLRVYTPLQFENSLGKLQCVSVTAPRKIIDTDVVTLERDADAAPARDSRRTRQLLLELEALYALVLRAEDLLSATARANAATLRELRQKQRLREMDAAATSEQKQALLRLLQAEAAPPSDAPADYLLRTMAGLLHDDRFAAFLNIRKGKMLLLRVLPLLGADYSIDEYAALWSRVLLGIPFVGRRDMAGDNLLPRLHPYFKRFVQMSRMSDVLRIVGKLEQRPRIAETRCTPVGYQPKPPLLFVLANKFGVSALVTILVRTEYLISAGNASAHQMDEWLAFLQSWADAASGHPNIATPIELIPRPVFAKHANRFQALAGERKLLLEKHFVDVD